MGKRPHGSLHRSPGFAPAVRASSPSLDQPERCILAALDLRLPGGPTASPLATLTTEQSVEELAELARSAGAEVIGRAIQMRHRAVARTLLGSGKVREIHGWAAESECDFVLFDHDLTPSQHRNLERELECPVLDRTQLILDIFAKHARSREGRLQVELAQLSYLLPRLAGRGAAMSRLGGGIGTRGPGETQLEVDRRKIRARIMKLERQLDKVRSTRRLQRRKRTSVPIPTVALCGYTNAGKSTLFNALTAARVHADSRMFATLDPTHRKLALPSGRPAILSDTVGFIRNLPPALIDAFHATLEDISEASLILHVVDISADHSDVYRKEVERVLDTLGAGERPSLVVLNKVDLLAGCDGPANAEHNSPAAGALKISARTGLGLDHLLEMVDDLIARDSVMRRRFLVPYGDGSPLALLYDRGHVLQRRDSDRGIELTVEVSEPLANRLARYAEEQSRNDWDEAGDGLAPDGGIAAPTADSIASVPNEPTRP